MRSYVLVSTIVFVILTAGQLTRLLLGWPVVIAGFNVPVWFSGVAVLVVGAMAAWGIRVLMKAGVPAA